MKPGDRVVIAAGRAWGRRGAIVEFNAPMKPYGKRTSIDGDDGERYYFQDYEANAFFPEKSADAAAVLAKYDAVLGPSDLAADVKFVAEITGAKGSNTTQALDRIVRHGLLGLDALLDLLAYELEAGMLIKPPGWAPPTMRAVRALGDAATPKTIERCRAWFATAKPHVAMTVATAIGSVELLRALCELTPEADRKKNTYRGLVLGRLAAKDPTVYADLADLVIARRTDEGEDGPRWRIAVGALSPIEAGDVLGAASSDRTIDEIDVQAGSPRAYNGFDLARWLAWPPFEQFPRVVLSQAFTGTKPLEKVLASPHLSRAIEHLDLSACDIGLGACRVLGKAKALASLRSLVLDRGDYDKSKFDRKCLEALFPKKGTALASLEHLSILRATATDADVHDIASNAPALRTVRIGRETIAIER